MSIKSSFLKLGTATALGLVISMASASHSFAADAPNLDDPKVMRAVILELQQKVAALEAEKGEIGGLASAPIQAEVGEAGTITPKVLPIHLWDPTTHPDAFREYQATLADGFANDIFGMAEQLLVLAKDVDPERYREPVHRLAMQPQALVDKLCRAVDKLCGNNTLAARWGIGHSQKTASTKINWRSS